MDSTGLFQGMLLMAAHPDGARRMQRVHRRADNGRCCGCTTPGTGTPMGDWPCLTRVLADSALAYLEGASEATVVAALRTAAA